MKGDIAEAFGSNQWRRHHCVAKSAIEGLCQHFVWIAQYLTYLRTLIIATGVCCSSFALAQERPALAPPSQPMMSTELNWIPLADPAGTVHLPSEYRGFLISRYLEAQRQPHHKELESAALLQSETQAPSGSRQTVMALEFAALSLALLSLVLAAIHVIRGSTEMTRPPSPVPNLAIDYEQRCRTLLVAAVTLWREAEAAVLELGLEQPLRKLLTKELHGVGRQLGTHTELNAIRQGAVSVHYSVHYWRMLSRDLARANKELSRISVVARAGAASIGSKDALPLVPKDIGEAYFVLGVNDEVSEDTLKRLVRALRQCWHPDLAQTDRDRSYREARIRQINVANDLIMRQASH